MASGGAVLVAFFLGEPYAFLDFREFWRSISEQGAMVRNAGTLPYTNQYVGVPNFLYEAREIVLWGLGPLLGVAALWASARKVAFFRRLSDVEWVFVSYFVPYVVLTCTFEVKFPRYLLPVYPLLALWATAWLTEKAERGRAGRVLRAAVVGGTVAGTGTVDVVVVEAGGGVVVCVLFCAAFRLLTYFRALASDDSWTPAWIEVR